MTTSFTALVENVITCPVCLRHFDEPRMLPCKHTFCFECIQQMTSKNNGLLECPKKDGTKVEGNNINALPPNQTVRDLIQLFNHSESASVPCHGCATNEAEHWCDSDCKHCFCSNCWDTIHRVDQYRNHTKVPVGNRPREVAQCQGHGDHSIQFWCEQCSREICGECKQTQHGGHTSTEIGTYVNKLEEQCQVSLEGVHACLNYRSDRADKLIIEVEKESEFNETQVRDTMQNLRNLIDRREETLLDEIRQEETTEKRRIEEHKRSLQDEQQKLIEQVLNFAVVSKDKQPQRLLDAKRPFDEFIRRTDARLIELKPLSRIKKRVTNVEDLAGLRNQIENIKFVPRKHANQVVEQKFPDNSNSTTVDLSSSQLKDLDMELVANKLAINRTLQTLKLYANEISDMGAQYLADVLRTNQTLTNLELYNNKIGTDGLEDFADALRTNKTLKTLTLYQNSIKDEVAQCVADGLKTNKEMETQIRNVNKAPAPKHQNPQLSQKIANNGNNTTLNLGGSQLTDQDMEIVAEALKTNTVVTRLNLYDNQIGDVGAKYVADALQSNRTLTQLRLYQNGITDTGAQYLANALRTNQVLTVLLLGNNQITDTGAQQLANALNNNRTLKQVYLNTNAITDVGAQHFANMLANNRTLQMIYLGGNANISNATKAALRQTRRVDI